MFGRRFCEVDRGRKQSLRPFRTLILRRPWYRGKLSTNTTQPARSAAGINFHTLFIFAPDSVQSAKDTILAQRYSGNSGFFHIVFHRIVENRERILETNMRTAVLAEKKKTPVASSGLLMFAVKMKAIRHR